MYRGVFRYYYSDIQTRESYVRIGLNGQEMDLNPEALHSYTHERFKNPIPPEQILELAEAALAATVHLDAPGKPHGRWGFVTDRSLKPNGYHHERMRE